MTGEEAQENLSALSEIVIDILDQKIVDVTFSEMDTQDNINTIRHSHFGFNEVFTQEVDKDGKAIPGTMWYAAIRDLPTTNPDYKEKTILYTATDNLMEEGEYITQAGREITTRDVAQNLMGRYQAISNLDSRNVFDVFDDTNVHAKKFGMKKLTDGATQYSITAYNEDAGYFNFSYALSITISEDEKDILALQLNIEKCYDDFWNETTHTVNGSAFDDGNAYRHTITIKDITFANGSYDPDPSLEKMYFDFSDYLLVGVDAHILADSGEGEDNKIGVGEYMQIIVDKTYPEMATEGLTSLHITGSSDTNVIGIDESVESSIPTYIAKNPGTCTLTVGNDFVDDLGTIDVEVVASTTVEEGLGIAEILTTAEEGYDSEENRFTFDGSKGEATFKIRLSEKGPYEEGVLEELTQLGEPYVISSVRIEEDENPNDDIVNLILTPASNGNSIFGILLPDGKWENINVTVTGEVVKTVSPVINLTSVEGMEADPSGMDSGIFRVSLSEGAKTFKAKLNPSILTSSNKVVIEGNEIEYYEDASDYVTAEFQNVDQEAGTVDIVITPKAVGSCEIKIPTEVQGTMTFKEYFRVIVEE